MEYVYDVSFQFISGLTPGMKSKPFGIGRWTTRLAASGSENIGFICSWSLLVVSGRGK